MELQGDKQIPMDKLFKILVKVREASHVETLNSFKKDENLEGLAREEVEMKLLKSFNIDTEELSWMFGKAFDRVELICLAHFAIEEANISQEGVTPGASGLKRKEDGDRAEATSKKAKVTGDSAVSLYILFDLRSWSSFS